jgi:type II secretory pathway pseudopilin PulG
MRKADRRGGFTLIEVTLVTGIILIITAVAIPNMITVISNARLRAGLTSMSGLLQNTRMLAVKQNKAMSSHFYEESSEAIVAYVKPAYDTSDLKTSDPQVKWEAPIHKMDDDPTGPGAPPAITTTVLGFTPETEPPSFNTGGLPCQYSSGVCTNKGFVMYFKDTGRDDDEGWAAISITPAGRIKKWYWNESSLQWIN